MPKDFDLELTDQYWLPPSAPDSRDPHGCPADTTSHGKIVLRVQGQDISGCTDPDTDYGINQSAVMLLRSVFFDHIPPAYDSPLALLPPMFFHGCSILGTCPNCVIDFRVRHLTGEKVILDQFYVTGGPRVRAPKQFFSCAVRLPNAEYAGTILRFTRKALAFLPPSKGVDYEIALYEFLRNALEGLAGLTEAYLTQGRMTTDLRKQAALLGTSIS